MRGRQLVIRSSRPKEMLPFTQYQKYLPLKSTIGVNYGVVSLQVLTIEY